jgi:hypothetical protein
VDIGDVPAFDEDLEGWLDHHFPATDLNGITLRISGFGDPYHENPVYAARYTERRERVERRFNVNLDFSNDDIVAIAGGWSDVPDAVVASIAAGDPLVHLFRGNAGYWFPSLANGGHLRDMDATIRSRLPGAYFNYIGESATGRAYGFMTGPAYAWNILAYNRDLIRSVGMEYTPSEMFIQGRWSYDDFYEYLAELNSRLPAEVTPLGAHQNWLKRFLVFSNGGYIVNPRTRIPGHLNDNTMTALNFMARLVEDGLFLQPGFVAPEPEGTSPFPTGHMSWAAAFVGGSHADLFRDGLVAIGSAAPWDFGWIGENFEFGVVPPPWGPDINFPGNWRDLKTHTPYQSVFNDGSSIMLVNGTPDAVTPDVYINMVFTWYENDAERLVDNMTGNMSPDGVMSLGSSQYLFTDTDVMLWEWYASNSVFEIMDGSNYWTLPVQQAWLNSLGGMTDFRTSFEAIMPHLVWAQYDAGIILRENIPDHLWVLAAEYGAGLEE